MSPDWLKLLVNNAYEVDGLTVIWLLFTIGILCYYTVACYLSHNQGGKQFDDNSTGVEWMCVILITYILVDDPSRPILTVLVGYAAVILAAMRAIDRGTCRLAVYRRSASVHGRPGEQSSHHR